MAQQSLYRRYRPRRFGEIKGQEHVVRALRNAVAQESEGHAYLFSGPRGTGKTSTARILAKALNCTNLTDGEPCCECESCLAIEAGKSFDLFELDAASNNGVDAVRDLVERSAVSSPGRTKVYILDEVHMLTAAASNALLKTLEEPPEHVRFVLATTDPQKVLPTIRSRTQHFEFFLLSSDELTEHVRWVAKDAGLDVDDEALAYAVRQGRGSVRDTLSALDQVVAAGGVLVRPEPVEQLFEAIAGRDPGVAVVAVADSISQGHDPRVLAEAFLSSVRDAFLVSLGVDTPHMVDADRGRTARWAAEMGTAGLTRAMERIGVALVDMRTAADPRVPLEVALVQLTADTAAAPEAPADGAPVAVEPEPAALDEIRMRLEQIEAKLRGTSRTERGESGRGGRGTDESGPQESARSESAGSESAGPERAGPEPAGAGPAEARPAEPAGADQDSGARAGPAAGKPERPQRARTSGRAAPPPPPPRRRGGSPPSAPARAASTRAPAEEAPGGTPAPGSRESAAPGTTPGPPAAGSSGANAPDRDSIVMAFGDSVVPELKGVAKAIYSGGRFLAVVDGTAVFALDNAPTVQRAEKYRSAVEELLGSKLGVPVPIRLVTEADAGAYAERQATVSTASAPAASASAAGEPMGKESTAQRPEPAARRQPDPGLPTGRAQVPATDPGPETPGGSRPDPGGAPQPRAGDSPAAQNGADVEDEVDLAARVDDLEDADVATRGVDRLTEAFPGAELIENEEKR